MQIIDYDILMKQFNVVNQLKIILNLNQYKVEVIEHFHQTVSILLSILTTSEEKNLFN